MTIERFAEMLSDDDIETSPTITSKAKKNTEIELADLHSLVSTPTDSNSVA